MYVVYTCKVPAVMEDEGVGSLKINDGICQQISVKSFVYEVTCIFLQTHNDGWVEGCLPNSLWPSLSAPSP